MGESRWDRERRHLNEDHEARRKQSKMFIELLKTSTPASSPKVSEEFIRLGAEWMRGKTAILSEISDNPFLSEETRATWSGVLERATLTDDDDTALTDLKFKMMLEAARFDGRVGRLASLTALGGELSTLIDTRVQARGHL